MLTDVSQSRVSEANFITLSYLCASMLCQVLLSRRVERVGRLHQSYTERPSHAATRYRSSRPHAKQPTRIAPRDHVPSCSQVTFFEIDRLAQCSLTRRPPSVGESGHPRTLRVSLDPAGLNAHICLYVASILQTASTTAPLICFPAGNTSAHEQARRIPPTIPL